MSSWKPPFKFLWQSPGEVADQPGVCTHRAEIGIEIEVVDAVLDRHRAARYRLRHAAELKVKDRNETCPLEEGPRRVLFETAVDEAISCLRGPLEKLLAPRGHVTAHRRARGGSRANQYLVSLGRAQGIESGDRVEIRREQHASTPTGDAWRTERVIAAGVVTDQVRAEEAWVAVDPTEVTEEILAGDVVRPVIREGLLSSLSGPNCDEILEVR